MTEYEEVPLFELMVAPHRRDRFVRKPTTVRYTRYQPKRRQLCDLCVQDIHARGMAVAPFPMAVRWRRTDLDGRTEHLCNGHKEERAESDD